METFARLTDASMALMGPYIPRLLGALTIIVAAWVAAAVLRAALTRAAARIKLDERMSSPGLAASLATVAGSLVWLMALPALLGTLEMNGLLAPVNAMMSRFMGFVPNLIGALVVLGVGLLVARIVRQVVSGLMRAAGSEKLAAKMGLASALGEGGLAGMAGQVLFVLLLLPTLVAALQPLGLDALTQPLSRLFETILVLVPKLLSAAVLIAVAAMAGRALASVVRAVLAGAGVDDLHKRLGTPPLTLGGRSLSELGSTGALLAVVVVAVAQATEVLGLPVLTEMVTTVGAAMARLGTGLIILIAGMVLAAVAAQAVKNSNRRNAAGLAFTAQAVIWFFAGALALRQAGLPAEIVAIAFGAVVGAVAVAVAVAFGVGGRHVAERALQQLAASFDLHPGMPAAPASSSVVTSTSPAPEAPAPRPAQGA